MNTKNAQLRQLKSFTQPANGARSTSYSQQIALVALSLLVAGTVGCTKQSGFGDLQVSANEGSTEAALTSKYDINMYPMNKVVCDPFGGEVTTTVENGLKAELFYRGAGQPRYYSAQDYVDHTTKSTQSLFFTDLNVPTRMFDQGFATQSSDVVKDDAGTKLIEFFGLKFTTNIRLSPDQPEGNYEFTLLADDGAVMKANVNEQWVTLISNDGDHPTRMGCATRTVHLTQGQDLPVEITYYQGPRYHISAVLMWKPVVGETPQGDSLCGKQGNTYFFDPNHNSVPLKPYQDLLARGWTPVSSNNFYVTSTTSYNPCVSGTNPVITGFQLLENFGTAISVGWTTDIPATTQVLITNVATGEQIVTNTDNTLTTTHSLFVDGLQPATTYTIQAVGVSADLGRSVSAPITVTTIQ